MGGVYVLRRELTNGGELPISLSNGGGLPYSSPLPSTPATKQRALPGGLGEPLPVTPLLNSGRAASNTPSAGNSSQTRPTPPKRPPPPAASTPANCPRVTSSADEWNRMSERLNAATSLVTAASADSSSGGRDDGPSYSSSLLALMASGLLAEGGSSETSESQQFSDRFEQDSNADLQTKIG